MDDPRTEAPELELTAPTANAEDALQLGPADLPAPAAAANDPFAMHLADVKPVPDEPVKNLKSSKPVTGEANQSVVAALMGLSFSKGKSVQKTASEPAPAPVSDAAATSQVIAVEVENAVVDGEASSDAATEVADPIVNPVRFVAPVIEESATNIAASESLVPMPVLSESPSNEDDEIVELVATPFEPVAYLEPVFEVIHAKGFNVEPHIAEPVAAETAVTVSVEAKLMAATPAVMSGVAASLPASRPPVAERTAAPAPVSISPAPDRKPLFVKPPTPPAAAVKPAVVATVTIRPAEPPRRAIPVAPVWPTSPAEAAAPVKIARPQTPATSSLASSPVAAAAPIFDAKQAALAPLFEMKPAAPVSDWSTLDEIIIDPPAGSTGAWWTIPLTFVGIAIVACAVLIPAADENRRTGYELTKIEQDVTYFQNQSAVNQDFLRRVNTDATLAERLAMRQLHQTRAGVKVAPLAGHAEHFGGSPYAMTRLDPPAQLPPYQPVPGELTEWFLGDKNPQQMASLGLIVAGAGVLLGGLRTRRVRPLLPIVSAA